jgi:hypothetical protein
MEEEHVEVLEPTVNPDALPPQTNTHHHEDEILFVNALVQVIAKYNTKLIFLIGFLAVYITS